MKVKRIILFLLTATLIVSFVGCGDAVKEYDKTPLTKLTYSQVDYNGGFTTEYMFDFENNIAIKHPFLPYSRISGVIPSLEGGIPSDGMIEL